MTIADAVSLLWQYGYRANASTVLPGHIVVLDPVRTLPTSENPPANARLIAAAPELLARLIKAESLLTRVADSPSLASSWIVPTITEALPGIRAAIRKAR